MTSWLSALSGGVLIGLSATLLLWLNGRIAGISGIVNGMLRRHARGELAWRFAFLAGLMAAGAITMRAMGQGGPSPASLPLLIVAGLLVGFGTSMGGGCTSGHGVCGLGRMSKRSLVAVAVFMSAAIATVLVLRLAGVRT
jgi:uncharacterized membrane protein YedE/YeeE